MALLIHFTEVPQVLIVLVKLNTGTTSKGLLGVKDAFSLLSLYSDFYIVCPPFSQPKELKKN